jgi:succinyl-CoA synthetase beta subunit
MKIHEYQAKEIFAEYGIPIPANDVCRTVEEVVKIYKSTSGMAAIKAQVLVGGRGKAGGVKLARTLEDAEKHANAILGMEIKGLTVEKVLVYEALEIVSEFYVGFTTDRNTKSVMMMASAEGGVEIEVVAKESPEKIIKLPIDPRYGLMDFQARNVAMELFGDVKLARQAVGIFQKLFRCYMDLDSSLTEINPLVLTPDGELIALDAKMNFDDNALYRHPQIEAMREVSPDEAKEISAKEMGLSYIKLDGEIGCMVNGAGLAMATMDIIKLYGGSPANFLDIGGSSNPEKVVEAMNILLSDDNVKVVMINIFGGITRCDDVARGLSKALDMLNVELPVVVRLSGTNAEEGRAILSEKNLITAESMGEAARKAIELAK